MKAVGFESMDRGMRMVLSEKNEDKELLYNAMLRLNEEAMALGIARDEVPRLPSKEQIRMQ